MPARPHRYPAAELSAGRKSAPESPADDDIGSDADAELGIDPAAESAFVLHVLLTDPHAGPGLAAMKEGDPEGYADAVREYAAADDGDDDAEPEPDDEDDSDATDDRGYTAADADATDPDADAEGKV